MLQLRVIGPASELRALIHKLIGTSGVELEVTSNELPARTPGAVRQYLNLDVRDTGRIETRVPNREH